jgi:hypothetical protein
LRRFKRVRTRLSPRLAALLAITVVAALALVGYSSLQSHRHAERAAAFRRAEYTLQTMALPTAVVDVANVKTGGVQDPCTSNATQRCLYSTVAIKDVDPVLRSLFTSSRSDCGISPCQVHGRIDGQDAVAFAVPHLYKAPNGHVPPGSTLLPGGHAYASGCYITLILIGP